MKRAFALLVLGGCMVGSGIAQTLGLSSTLPKVGNIAPALSFTKVLNAPAGEKVSLASLRGRVVVLEFWATWCAPCVGEIPVVNALVSSLDPKKVQFISVDDEDSKVVEAFLKKKPIAGWVGLDSTGGIFKRYGVDSRPTTVVIGPDGRVVSNSVRPEALQRDKLLELAAGKKTDVGGKVDAKVQAQLDASVEQAFAAEMRPMAESGDALFELKVSAAEKSAEKVDTHVMMMGPGKLDITHADVKTLLSMGAGVAAGRLKVEGKLPEGEFNLHVNAPGADKGELQRAIEMAVASAAGARIEHVTKSEDALVLTALPGAKSALSGPAIGFAAYQKKTHTLRCLGASVDQVASALEQALGKPVVNETSLTGSVTMDIPLPEGDVAAANAALAKALGLTLTPAVRPIERVVVTAAPVADGKGYA